MRRNYGYKYFSNQRKKSFFKKLSFVSSLLLIAQISLGGLFFISPTANNEAQANTMCAQPADVILIMDRSGSMDYTSRCDWSQFKCINSPSCSEGYKWVRNTDYNQTQAWCTARNQTAPNQSVYLAINSTKLNAATSTANNFLGLMKSGDQSALVSYATSATLDKTLSNDHPATIAAVKSLVSSGATDIGDAIKLANQEFTSIRHNPSAVKIEILLTDGLANKPNGSGFGENPTDVAYAQAQAVLADNAGIKIFTIGFGDNGEIFKDDGEINETMLKNIASTTKAQYYHAPSQYDLQAIYNSIALKTCEYTPSCGNFVLDSGEQCDDGNIINNDGCSTQCTTEASQPVCGNGLVESGEACDDGNLTNGDGCSATCAATAPTLATLHVVKQMNGGAATADLFNLHVKLADADVLGSPAAGVVAPGRFYSLAAGAYAVSEDYDAAYTPSFSGDCDSSGNITLAAGDNKTCTIINTRIQMYLPPMPPCEEIFGTVISSVDHSGFHYGNIPEEWAYFSVNSPTHGDSLDNSWVQGVNPITWDLGTSTRSIRIYPSQDHGGYPTEYFNEYAVQVSSDNLNWQPAVIGATYSVNSPAAIRVHDGARDFSSTMPFRYVKISLNAISGTIGGCDFEIDAVEICSDNSGGGGSVCGNGLVESGEACDDGNITNGDGCSAVCQTEGSGGGGGSATGSLKICKYEDSDGLASTTADRSAVSNWSFSVGDGIATSTPQLTLADGCTIFSALTPGQYFINEGLQTGWYYLEPANGLATTTVSAGQQPVVNFYNVRYGIISGYEFADADGLAGTAGDRTGLGDWTINLYGSSASTTILISTTTRADGYFEFLNLLPNNYSLTQNLKVSWINIISPAEINLLSGETKIGNNFVNSQTGGQGGGLTYCGDGIKQSPNDSLLGGPANNGMEDCDGGDGVTGGYTCNSQCVLASTGPGSGGGGGGGSIPLCILTNTCGLANPISTSTPTPTGAASSTGGVLGEKITKPVTNQVLGEKITAKPAGQVLSETGFKLSEFLSLLAVLLLLLNLIFIIKTKYLKAGGQNHGLLNKTLIFDQDLFIYQRADVYFKNR